MIVVQSIQRRCHMSILAAGRTHPILRAHGGGRGVQSCVMVNDVKVAKNSMGEDGSTSVVQSTNTIRMRYYSSYQPLPSIMLQQGYCYRRLFSKFSTDTSSPTVTTPKKTILPTLSSELQSAQSASNHPHPIHNNIDLDDDDDDYNSDEQQKSRRNTNSNKKLLIDLQDAHELFNQIYKESQALLKNNQRNGTPTSDEVVAMVDYYMLLVNSLDLEKHLDMVQTLQDALLEEKQQEREHNPQYDENCSSSGSVLFEDEGAIEEKLHQATKSMNKLHHVFLKMVESCLPPQTSSATSKETNDIMSIGDEPSDPFSFDQTLYSSKTVGRGLQLSRRAEELCMPIHLPLYQRLAMGSVLTSSNVNVVSPPHKSYRADVPEDVDDSISDEPASLIMPGQFQQSKETALNTSSLALELLGILHNARSTLKIVSGEQLQRLAEDLLSGPFLLLLKAKKFDDAMSLLRGWQALFAYDGDTIDLIHLLGEDNTLDALELAKGWLVDGGNNFQKDVEASTHAMELTGLLEISLAEIIKGRKRRQEKLNDLMWELSMQNGDDDFDDHDSDFDEHDSDSDTDIDFDYDSDDDEGEPTEFSSSDYVTLDSPIPSKDKIEAPLHFSTKVNQDDTITTSYSANHSDIPKIIHIPKRDDDDEGKEDTFTIMPEKGLSDKLARESIYLRNGTDWVLPDLVGQLEDWNKGNQLTFTPMFERYLGRQMTKESKGEDEEED